MVSLIKAMFWFVVVVGASYLMTTAVFWAYLHLTSPLPVDANRSVLTAQTSLKVQNSDSTQLQPVQAVYEDETLPSMTVQPTMLDNELQPMKHYLFLQDTVPQMMLQPTYDVSLAEEVTLVEPLIIYGTLETDGLRKL